MKLIALFVICLALLSSCCEKKQNKCHCDTSEVSSNDSILKSEMAIKGLPVFFRRFNQKPLIEQPNESYRLTTMHSFNRYYQVFTLTKTATGGNFLIQEYFCKKAYSGNCKLINQHHSKISMARWNSFKSIIDSNCFWTLPIADPDTGVYIDGGEWNIEGFQPSRQNCANSEYLITLRQMPFGSSDRFFNVYKAIMKMVDRKQIHELE